MKSTAKIRFTSSYLNFGSQMNLTLYIHIHTHTRRIMWKLQLILRNGRNRSELFVSFILMPSHELLLKKIDLVHLDASYLGASISHQRLITISHASFVNLKVSSQHTSITRPLPPIGSFRQVSFEVCTFGELINLHPV